MPRTAQHENHHQSLADLGLVAASIIHEVKNALQGIGSALFLLEHDSNLKPKEREWIATAQRELSRALDASRQTLALARQESPTQVCITQILDEVLDAYRTKAAFKGITIERHYEFNGTIEANEGAIREVFTNLVLNALEALPGESGKLSICTSPRNGGNGRDVAGVRILFADNGPGIPDRYRSKVFEPFFSTKKGKGTGLGLWVSDRLIEQQHGELRLVNNESSGNSGSCFSVFLPLSQNKPTER